MQTLLKMHDAREVAALFNLRAETIRQMARRGEIGALRVGRRYRFTQKHIENFMSRSSTQQR